jgi:hypothetical protein
MLTIDGPPESTGVVFEFKPTTIAGDSSTGVHLSPADKLSNFRHQRRTGDLIHDNDAARPGAAGEQVATAQVTDACGNVIQITQLDPYGPPAGRR